MASSLCSVCSRPLPAESLAEGVCQTCRANTGPTDLESLAAVSSAAAGMQTQAAVGLAQSEEVTRTYHGAEPQTRVALTEHLEGYDTPLPEMLRQLPPAPPGYELIKRLGSGGMGDVFLAREYPTERLVAMKMLRSPGNAIAAERFISEVRALARLNHPHIVKVLATDFLRQQPFFTMEYVSGGTLADRLRQGPLDPREAARLIMLVARAVQAAHTAQVLHRDIKPSNILLDDEGQPHISDFGLAKMLDRDDGLVTMTGPLGTPSYMPPEQCSRRYGPIGPAADVYSLGATLYHLVTGQTPHSGKTPAEIIQQIETEMPARPRALRPDLPLALEAIILKCLQKRQEDRYPTAQALAEDLERFLQDAAPSAPLHTPWRRLWLWTRRQRPRLLAATAVLLLLTVAAILGAMLPRSEGPSPDERLAALMNSLRQGESVTLIGPTGLPAWSKVLHGNVALSSDETSERACVYSSLGYGLVLLLPEVPMDQYTLEAEIRLVNLVTARREGLQMGGLFFGYLPNDSAMPGCVFHAVKHVSFLDHHYVPENPETYPHPEHVYFGDLILLERPGDFPILAFPRSPHRHPFTPSIVCPAPWRKIQIKVRPDLVETYWRDERGQMVRFAAVKGPALDKQAEVAADSLRKSFPQLDYPTPDWHPRRGLGLWCHRAVYAVRNLTLTPGK
jgi:serine/threonine protein kinase